MLHNINLYKNQNNITRNNNPINPPQCDFISVIHIKKSICNKKNIEGTLEIYSYDHEKSNFANLKVIHKTRRLYELFIIQQNYQCQLKKMNYVDPLSECS